MLFKTFLGSRETCFRLIFPVETEFLCLKVAPSVPTGYLRYAARQSCTAGVGQNRQAGLERDVTAASFTSDSLIFPACHC